MTAALGGRAAHVVGCWRSGTTYFTMSRLDAKRGSALPWWAAQAGYGLAYGVFSAWSTSWRCRWPSRSSPGLVTVWLTFLCKLPKGVWQ